MTAKITATCGHEIPTIGEAVAVASYDRDGSRAVAYMTLCDVCLAEELYGRVLHSLEEEMEWNMGGDNDRH